MYEHGRVFLAMLIVVKMIISMEEAAADRKRQLYAGTTIDNTARRVSDEQGYGYQKSDIAGVWAVLQLPSDSYCDVFVLPAF